MNKECRATSFSKALERMVTSEVPQNSIELLNDEFWLKMNEELRRFEADKEGGKVRGRYTPDFKEALRHMLIQQYPQVRAIDERCQNTMNKLIHLFGCCLCDDFGCDDEDRSLALH